MDIGLVLQGGGALGAYEWGALRYLVGQGLNPVAVSGVSIGAINAAAIAGAKDGDIIRSLDALWQAITLPDVPWLPANAQARLATFGNPAFYRPRADYWDLLHWDSLYTTAPMIETLDDLIDFTRLNDPTLMKTTLTVTRVRDGMQVAFDNAAQTLTAQHILASGSLPPGFPMTIIDDEAYMDGGLFRNTPLPQLLSMLSPEQLDTLPIFVVDLVPVDSKRPTNLMEVIDRSTEITFENRLEASYGGQQGLRARGRLMAAAAADPIIAKDPELQDILRERAYRNVEIIDASNMTMSGAGDFSAPGTTKCRKAGEDAAARCLDRFKPKAVA